MLKSHCVKFTDHLQQYMGHLTKDLGTIWLHLHDFTSVDEAKIHLLQDLQRLRSCLDELEQMALTPSSVLDPERKHLMLRVCQKEAAGGDSSPIGGYTYLIACTRQEEGICLVWDGWGKSTLTAQILCQVEKEADEAGCMRPLHIYARVCDVSSKPQSWLFWSIP